MILIGIPVSVLFNHQRDYSTEARVSMGKLLTDNISDLE